MFEQRISAAWRSQHNVRVYRVERISKDGNLHLQEVEGLHRTFNHKPTDGTAWEVGDYMDVGTYSRGGNLTIYEPMGRTPEQFTPQPTESEEAGSESEESEEATGESGKPHRGRPRKAS